MSGFNRVILSGNLTRQPELRYTAKGTATTTAGLAVNRRWRDDSGADKEEVTFVDVQCWGKLAENVCQYLNKGSRALVEGRLKLDSWEEEGQKRQKLIVVAETVQFLDSASTSAGRNQNAPQGKPRAHAPNPI